MLRALQLQFATASLIRVGCKFSLPHHASEMNLQLTHLLSGYKSSARCCRLPTCINEPFSLRFVFYNGARSFGYGHE